MLRNLTLAVIVSLVLAVGAASAQQDSMTPSKRREPPGYPRGVSSEVAQESEAEWGELMRLEKAGGRKAVKTLEGKLTSPDTPDWVKRGSLLALGRIGSRRAVEAVQAFETWAQARALATPAEWLVVTRHPSHHVSSSGFPYRAFLTCQARDGSMWGFFMASPIGGADLWLAQIGENGPGEPLLLDLPLSSNGQLLRDLVGRGHVKLEPGETAGTFALRVSQEVFPLSVGEAGRDSDGDGLADRIEQRLGLNPASSDTDGDGISDREDSNPLAGRTDVHDDAGAIRQAVFSFCMATTNSILPVQVRLNEETPKEPYLGYRGIVLHPDAPLPGIFSISIRITELGDDAAVVSYGDYLGPMAASGNTVRLRKRHGKWFVTDFHMDVIS